MNQDVTDYINKLKDNPKQQWQAEVCHQLRQLVHNAVPEITERLQYSKPHFLKNGKYACVIGAAKGWVTFTIFNARSLTAPADFFEAGPEERKTLKVLAGQTVDYKLLEKMVEQTAATIP
ncbi:MAG: DUF1801 domain-containing protein [Anaerolineae bacterium]